MKNLYKISLLPVALLGIASLASCDDSKNYPGYVEGSTEGPQVYFAPNNTDVAVVADETDYTYTVYRSVAGPELTVPVYVEPVDDDVMADLFTFADQVTFAEGSLTADLAFTCDANSLPYDSEQQFWFILDPEYTTVFGATRLMVSITKNYTFAKIGKGTYFDYGWYVDGNGPQATPDFYICEQNPNIFRLSNPYSYIEDDADEMLQLQILQVGDKIAGVTITQPGLVYYPDFRVEYDADEDDDFYLVWPGRFTSLASESAWLKNRVISYQPAQTLEAAPDMGEVTIPSIIQLAPMYYAFNTGGYNYTQYDGVILIYFPGLEVFDDYAEVTYSGILTNTSNKLEVIAYVEIGEDVSEAKVAILPGSEPTDDDLSDIDEGTITSISINETGTVNIPFEILNDEGTYCIVALTYVDGEMANYGFDSFTYQQNPNLLFSLVDEGTYTYLNFWETNLELTPEVLELYESDATPGNFKITHWFYDQDFAFTMDENYDIMVDEQPTGVNLSSGALYVDDASWYADYWNDWFDEDPIYSYYEDGVYYFAVLYYAGSSAYAGGYETFVPSTEGGASTANIWAKSNLVKTGSYLKAPVSKNVKMPSKSHGAKGKKFGRKSSKALSQESIAKLK